MKYWVWFCTAYCALVWIGGGLLHFVGTEETIAQIPEFVPFKLAVVYISGVVELAIGFLIIPKATRKSAAFASLIMLAVLFPAMVKVFRDGGDVHGFIYTILVPGNLILAYCSWYLWKKTKTS